MPLYLELSDLACLAWSSKGHCSAVDMSHRVASSNLSLGLFCPFVAVNHSKQQQCYVGAGVVMSGCAIIL